VLHHRTLKSCGIFFIFPLLLLLVSPRHGSAQELQRTAFSFLNISPSARINGLGGSNVSLTDADVNNFFSNPGTVSDTLAGTASLNYTFYVADIGHAAFTYLDKFGRAGLIAIGVNHFSYGKIEGFDYTGAPLSEFNASETAIVVSKNHQINQFRFGVSLKGAFSSLAGLHSNALMVDVGGVFIHPEENWQVGMVLKNAGFIVSDYTGTSDSALPIDLQIGATIKPQHMPVRFSLTAYRLIQSKGIEYLQNQPASPSSLQKVLRHFNFGAELLFHRNVNLLVGYNYGIHQELKLENAGGSAGISYGFSARIKAIEFVFSRRTLVSGSPGYGFSLSTDVRQFLKRK
jgi:hypothetical protein